MTDEKKTKTVELSKDLLFMVTIQTLRALILLYTQRGKLLSQSKLFAWLRFFISCTNNFAND